MNKMLIESKKEILQTLNSNQNPQTIPQEIEIRQPRQEQHQQQNQPQQQTTTHGAQNVGQNSNNLHLRPTNVTGLNTEGNYNELFLNRLRLHRSCNVIIFNLAETNDLWVDEVSQKYIDEQEVNTILDWIEDKEINLRGKVVEMIRLGRKSENKIRPVRIRFENEYYRNVAVMNGFRINYF